MKGIIVTTELKNKNKKFFSNDDVGEAVKKNIPNKFHGVENQNCGNYKSRLDLQELDGWREIVKPLFDAATEKLEELFYNSIDDEFTYRIVALTDEEILELSETTDEDIASQKVNDYRIDGVYRIEKTRTKIWKRIHLYPDGSNVLTRKQAGKLERWFKEIYASLLVGNWRQAQNEMENLIEERGETGDNSLNEAEGMLNTTLYLQ